MTSLCFTIQRGQFQTVLQVAFDKHWNLALVDVDETFTRKRFPKTANFDVETISRELEEMNVSGKKDGKKSSKNSDLKSSDKNSSKSKTGSIKETSKDKNSSKKRVDEKPRTIVKREQVEI
jgi:hypothetical protein